MQDIENDNFTKIFYPAGINVIDDSFNFDKKGYKEHLESVKYSDMEKAKYIGKIILKYDILKHTHLVVQIKKIIPNGLNEFDSMSDLEYERLKKEFPI
jgi:hypothetical protein